MVIAGGHPDIHMGTRWVGEYGWVYVDRGRFETSPADLVNEVIGPNEVQLYKSTDHYQNFLDCVKTRTPTITPGGGGPPLGQRRPPECHRHRARPEDPLGAGDRDGPRRPRGRAASQPLLPKALGAAALERPKGDEDENTKSRRFGAEPWRQFSSWRPLFSPASTRRPPPRPSGRSSSLARTTIPGR